MAPNLTSDSLASDSAETVELADGSAYRVSITPIVPARNGNHGARDADDLGLPGSYGLETLWLLPRDPHTLFAYWDIDWPAAFGEESPQPRKVHLRILDAAEAEVVSLEVEPMAGHCAVNVPEADAAYRGEIGFFENDGAWVSISHSASVSVPPEIEINGEAADFATIPLHLTFQRMLDVTRRKQAEDDSLTDILADLRERANTAQPMTLSQEEVFRAMEAATSSEPQPSSAAPDLWAQHRLEEVIGFGNSSLGRGFGGSSRN